MVRVKCNQYVSATICYSREYELTQEDYVNMLKYKHPSEWLDENSDILVSSETDEIVDLGENIAPDEVFVFNTHYASWEEVA